MLIIARVIQVKVSFIYILNGAMLAQPFINFLKEKTSSEKSLERKEHKGQNRLFEALFFEGFFATEAFS